MMSAAIEAYQPDLVHIHNTWFRLSPAVVAAAHAGVPVVMTLHNYRLACSNAELLRDGKPCRLCVDGSLWNGVLHSCYRDPLSSSVAALTIARGRKRVWPSEVDRFLALSAFAIDLFAQAGIAREQVTLKDNFVTDPGPRDRSPAESREILFVGRLSPEKGIAQLLARRDQFSAAGFSLVVIGDGPLRSTLARATDISYLGPQPVEAVARHMLDARALVMPSVWYEGQPRVALEAFAAGLPVVGSSLGAIGELLAAQPGSWTFEPNGDWSEALSRLGNDDKVAEASKAARQLWERRFAPAQGAKNLERVYAEALKEHNRHG
jgi:glycosyltransferase involved in cell wall biosynthesis